MLKIAIAAVLVVVIGTGSAIAGITLTHAAFSRAAVINGKMIDSPRTEAEALQKRSITLLLNLKQRTQLADVQTAKRG